MNSAICTLLPVFGHGSEIIPFHSKVCLLIRMEILTVWPNCPMSKHVYKDCDIKLDIRVQTDGKYTALFLSYII